MATKIFETAFQINAKLGNKFNATFNLATKTVNNLGATSAAMTQEFLNHTKALGTFKESMSKAQARINALDKSFLQGKIGLTGYMAEWDKLNKVYQANALKAADCRDKLKELGKAQREQAAVNAKNNFKGAAAGLGSAVSLGLMAGNTAFGFMQPAMEFQAMMSKVKAITGANSEEMAKLTAQARELGATTQFTARQSAEAMTFLGMAGWKTNEIMKGMPGLLSLAAAGGTDLARTADIISDDLTAFGLSADKAAHMADVFAVTITNTNTNVEMLGETMKYAAPVAHGFGISLEDTAALAGLMANGSIKASQAGTSLRAGLLRLVSPPKKASKALDEMGVNLQGIYTEQREAQAGLAALGIEMTDFNGKNRKMSAILTDLRNKTEGLAREEKLAALNAIFGTNASSGWLNVIEAGPEQFDALVKKLENCDGAAANVAKTMNDNARGGVIEMQSAIESLQITLGNNFLPIIGKGAKSIANMAGEMSKWAEANPATITTLAGLGSGLLAVNLALKAGAVLQAGYTMLQTAYAASTISATWASASYTTVTKLAATAQWALNAAMAANPVGLVIVGIGLLIGAGYLLIKNWDLIKDVFSNLMSYIQLGFAKCANFIIDKLNWLRTAIGAEPLRPVIEPVIHSAVDDADSYAIADTTQKGGKPLMAAYHNASGGIYAKGAFLTTFAEDSGESAIPHTRTAHNIGLLQRTNEIMGNPLSGGDTINATFSPVINISGNADAAAVSMAIDDGFEKFKRYMAQFQREQRRVSYA